MLFISVHLCFFTCNFLILAFLRLFSSAKFFFFVHLGQSVFVSHTSACFLRVVLTCMPLEFCASDVPQCFFHSFITWLDGMSKTRLRLDICVWCSRALDTFARLNTLDWTPWTWYLRKTEHLRRTRKTIFRKVIYIFYSLWPELTKIQALPTRHWRRLADASSSLVTRYANHRTSKKPWPLYRQISQHWTGSAYRSART